MMMTMETVPSNVVLPILPSKHQSAWHPPPPPANTCRRTPPWVRQRRSGEPTASGRHPKAHNTSSKGHGGPATGVAGAAVPPSGAREARDSDHGGPPLLAPWDADAAAISARSLGRSDSEDGNDDSFAGCAFEATMLSSLLAALPFPTRRRVRKARRPRSQIRRQARTLRRALFQIRRRARRAPRRPYFPDPAPSSQGRPTTVFPDPAPSSQGTTTPVVPDPAPSSQGTTTTVFPDPAPSSQGTTSAVPDPAPSSVGDASGAAASATMMRRRHGDGDDEGARDHAQRPCWRSSPSCCGGGASPQVQGGIRNNGGDQGRQQQETEGELIGLGHARTGRLVGEQSRVAELLERTGTQMCTALFVVRKMH
jgi:hypothetical protein